MKSNYSELVKQYIDAKAIKDSDISSETFEKDFVEWIKERYEMGKKYLSILKRCDMFKDSFKCAEVSKGIDDSITLDYHTRLVTPYIDIDMIDNPSRIIDGDFSVNEKHVLPIISNEEIKLKVIPNKEVKTYMTQNPYSDGLLEGWDALHNSGSNNVIVGIYGNINDSDKQRKIDMLTSFKRKLKDGYREVRFSFDDEYYHIIASNEEKTRIR